MIGRVPIPLFNYLKRYYTFERITGSEAETYDMFGITSIKTPKEFMEWIIKKIDEGDLDNPTSDKMMGMHYFT